MNLLVDEMEIENRLHYEGRNSMELKKDFDLYEFVGIIIPGFLALFSCSISIPEVKNFIWSKDISASLLGIVILLSYPAGQIVQLLGNILEKIWWKFWKGMPSNWVIQEKPKLLSKEQIVQLETKVSSMLGGNRDLSSIPPTEWYPIVRQINARVEISGANKKVETLLGMYGLNRGIAAAMLFHSGLWSMFQGMTDLRYIALFVILFVFGLIRMHMFGVNYARELFVRFIEGG